MEVSASNFSLFFLREKQGSRCSDFPDKSMTIYVISLSNPFGCHLKFTEQGNCPSESDAMHSQQELFLIKNGNTPSFMPRWVAGITCLARIAVPRNLVVFVGKVVGIVVLVAVNATEGHKIPRRGMALVAFVPLVFVLATENGEVQIVVLVKIICFPAGGSAMADTAVGGEARSLVVGVARVLKIGLVAGETVRRGILKNPSGVAGCTIVYFMAFCQREKIVVLRKARGRPSRIGAVADGAIGREISSFVVGVDCLVEIFNMAGRTIRRRTSITCGVALNAISSKVRPRQWEGRHVVVKTVVRIARRVAGEASRVIKRIAVYAAVLVIGFGVDMAIGATEFSIVCWVGMAVGTLVPLAFVRPAVNREILPVVVESRWHPFVLGMAILALGGKLEAGMGRVKGQVVIIRVAANTGVGRIVVIAVVALGTVICDSGMGAVQLVKIIVVGKSCGHPIRLGRMAACTVC